QENCLDRLSHNGLVLFEVSIDCGAVEFNLSKSFEQRPEREIAVGQRYADIPKHGRIGQIALKARDGKFGGQVLEHRIGDTKVAFRIFEVDRVHLMRHSRRAHFALTNLLLEILHRDVLPDVTAEIDENGIDAPKTVEKGSKVIVMLNLGGREAARQSEGRAKLFTEVMPVDGGIGDKVRIHIARSPAKLGAVGHGLQQGKLVPQAYREDVDLLPE